MARGPRRVFLSHTAELKQFPPDKSFVSSAEAAVARVGDAVGDMASFTARDEKPAAYVQQQVRSCDLYVGLIGLRYGPPVLDRPEMSYPELEFETATEAGMPRLVFMLDEDAALPIPVSQLFDGDRDLQARQRSFRDRLREAGITIGKVASPDQLELVLLQALQEIRQPVAPSARGHIFVSYRHEEASYPANWLYSVLTEHFGKGHVFMDVDDIEPGANFVDVINAAVASCEVMLAIIGDRWLEVTDADGKRRLDNPVDFVRLEIEAALARSIRVIPILVNHATMPRAGDLPASIEALAYRQALELSAHRFELDLDRLLKALDNALSAPQN
jgi:hypothetical protein